MSSKTSTRRLEFLSCLGAGGFGEVYLAEMITSSGLRRQVAVKTLHAELALRAEAVRRLRDEARLLAALNHRAILQVHDLVDLEGRLGLITEYVEGEDLATVIDAGETIPPRVCLEIVAEVAGALDAAWRAPSPDTGEPLALVHRDLKPSNIRLSPTGGVKLLDFGIARSEELTREARTSTGLVVGTLGYLAPERFTEDGVGPEGDVFALGCVLYEAVAGRRLYGGVTRRKLTRMALDEALHDEFLAERMELLPDQVGVPVRALMLKMLAHEPGHRPTAAEAERLCDEVASDIDGPHLRRWARDRSWPPAPSIEAELVGRSVTASGLVTGVSGRVDQQSSELVPGSGRNPTMAPYGASWDELPEHGETMAHHTGPTEPTDELSETVPAGSLAPPSHTVPSLAADEPELPPPGRSSTVALLVVTGIVVVVLALAGLGRILGSEPAPSQAVGTADQPQPGPVPGEAPPVEPPPQDEGSGTELSEAELSETEHSGTDSEEPPDPPGGEGGGDPQAGSTAAASQPAPPSPAPAPQPEPAAAAPVGTVQVKGSVPVTLQGTAGSFGPGAVPVGTYQVLADFGSGTRKTTSLTVGEGEEHTITCSTRVLNCRVD